MSPRDREYPCLRPVEAIPDPASGRIVLRDPTGLAARMLVVGEAQFVLLTLLDGRRRRGEIQAAFAREVGHLLPADDLDSLLVQLAGVGFLAGDSFDSYYERRQAEYRAAPLRRLRPYGPAAELPALLEAGLAEASPPALPARAPLLGLVVPHLDFPRGMGCYGAGYRHLRQAWEARPAGELRVVVLGTNHFGRAASVTATGQDFQTPWGVLPTDRDFLARLEEACGAGLRHCELDHLQEHSVELQAVWLHHLFGARVRLVPFLCPEPCGPNGTRAGDPEGVDLRDFALALGELVRRDPTPTLLLASADLSHVGRYFGDSRDLDPGFLESVRRHDEEALAWIDRTEPERYRSHMARTGNPTRVCSVGCLYALLTALPPGARAHRLRYHQAVTHEIDNCVTSAAYAFTA